ncbi:MAG: hypothetical protein EXS05_23835 [Planctomycetaceae bacterium]|nr:hypothetical protein [Planctomycetaceae bacterium]
MQRKTLPGIIIGLLLLWCGEALVASDADELRERARAFRKVASIMAERGITDQAERLEKEAMELQEAAERMEIKARGLGEKGRRPGIEQEARQLRERLEDLLVKERKMREAQAAEQDVAEVREQISNMERELQQIHAHHAVRNEHPPEFRAQAEKLEVASRRIHHIRVAAKNLKLAEVHDLALQLMEKADAMEREVQEAKQRLAGEIHDAHARPAEHGPDVVRELQREIERLGAEVNELRQQVEKR